MDTETETIPDLKSFVIEKIDELGKAALDYFKPFVPDLTRQKLSGLKKSGNFTWGFAEAIFANEDITIGAEPDVDSLPTDEVIEQEQPRPAMRGQPVRVEAGPQPPMEDDEGMTVVPAIPSMETMRPRRVGRAPDIREVTARPPAPGATRLPTDIDPGLFDQVQKSLLFMGWTPPGGGNGVETRRVPSAPPQNVGHGAGGVTGIGGTPRAAQQPRRVQVNRRVALQNWNEPRPVRR